LTAADYCKFFVELAAAVDAVFAVNVQEYAYAGYKAAGVHKAVAVGYYWYYYVVAVADTVQDHCCKFVAGFEVSLAVVAIAVAAAVVVAVAAAVVVAAVVVAAVVVAAVVVAAAAAPTPSGASTLPQPGQPDQ
jgi:hypothetical protein